MQHDLNFSVTSVIDPAGTLRLGFVYDPYGGRSTDGGAGGDTQADYNIGFQGGQYDVVMGAYKFGPRLYLPQLGDQYWQWDAPCAHGRSAL